MALPAILAGLFTAAGAGGVGALAHGGIKMKKANDTMKEAQAQHEKNIEKFEGKNKETTQAMDALGQKELEILHSFEKFSSIFERIQNKPEFKTYQKDSVAIPSYDAEDLKTASVGAGVLLGGLGGAALGTAGGFAAAGATTAAVMAFGTASTGTAIASLSGAAATNATLAALGGGAIAAGGGGMALGTTILGATTLGMGLLVGGIIFNFTGSKLSDKADEAYAQMKKAESEISKINKYLDQLKKAASKFETTLCKVDTVYQRHLTQLGNMVILEGKTDWNKYTAQEKLVTENTVLLVNLLFQMCKVKLVLTDEDGNDGINEVNQAEIDKVVSDAESFLDEKGLAALA